MRDNFKDRLNTAFRSIPLEKYKVPSIGIILGSGLGNYVSSIEGPILPFSEIEGFPQTTVEGHRGEYKFGKEILIQAGRFHFYEGYSLDDVVMPVFLLWKLGIKTLIITNASGGINKSYSAGEFVLIKDHINFIGSNPLIGSNNNEYGPRFPDMTEAYSADLRQLAQEAVGSTLKEGVYAALTGPSYETPAEIRMLRTIGADMVGMSTVPEVIAANYLGIKVMGISCVTNMAAGILNTPLSHEEVIETTKRVEKEFSTLVEKIILKLVSEY
ncbi:MAG: purine-nucleoside phosphorylase [Spirochaetales bacterium]|nr:purine-nucleoside phosphorylase [Spirochaetales bacterium]